MHENANLSGTKGTRTKGTSGYIRLRSVQALAPVPELKIQKLPFERIKRITRL